MRRVHEGTKGGDVVRKYFLSATVCSVIGAGLGFLVSLTWSGTIVGLVVGWMLGEIIGASTRGDI